MDHVIVFVSLVVAIAPMMAILLFIWWIDRYDREPLKYVFFAFFWGGFGAVILSILGTEVSIKVLGGAIYSPHFDTTAVLVAPAIEELMKGLIVLFFLRLRHFDNMTDGLLYGAASGLGFGMTENFLYFAQYASYAPGYEWLNLLFMRSMMTANMHAAASATFGAGISKLKDGGREALVSVALYYFLAVFLHSTWNFLVTSRSEAHWTLAVLILFFYIVFIFVMYVKSIVNERRQRVVQLDEEFGLGVLPEGYRKILVSYSAMKKNDWFPKYLNKDKYLTLVSRLALRKASYENAGPRRRIVLQREIAEIRAALGKFSGLLESVSGEKSRPEAGG
jgi:RsiW-degrading membrane proteinase PrsW (M82 family)